MKRSHDSGSIYFNIPKYIAEHCYDHCYKEDLSEEEALQFFGKIETIFKKVNDIENFKSYYTILYVNERCFKYSTISSTRDKVIEFLTKVNPDYHVDIDYIAASEIVMLLAPPKYNAYTSKYETN